MLADNLHKSEAVGFPAIGLLMMLDDTGSKTACSAVVRLGNVNRCKRTAGSIIRHGRSAKRELLRGCYKRKIGLDWQKSLFYAQNAIKTLVLMILFRLERGISDTVRSTLTGTSGSSDKERCGFCFLAQPIDRLIGFLEVGKVGVTTNLRVNNNKSWKL